MHVYYANIYIYMITGSMCARARESSASQDACAITQTQYTGWLCQNRARARASYFSRLVTLFSQYSGPAPVSVHSETMHAGLCVRVWAAIVLPFVGHYMLTMCSEDAAQTGECSPA